VIGTQGVRRRLSARKMETGCERGFTLVELLVAMMLSAILISIVMVVISSFFKAERDVDTSYTNLDQILPVSTSFQRLLRAAVSPAPTQAGTAATPPFGIYNSAHDIVTKITGTSLTFLANTGTPNGPTKVIAQIQSTVVTPTNHTQHTLTVWLIPPNATKCPRSTTTTNHCLWTSAKKRQLFQVDHVLTPPTAPIFTYFTSATNPHTPVEKVADPTTTFATCTSATCPADRIESVGVSLKVSVGGTTSNEADDETVVYEMSVTSQAYSPEVG